MPNVMVWESGAFGKWLGDAGRAFMNGMGGLIKETPPMSLDPSSM